MQRDSEHPGRRMLKMEPPGRGQRGKPKDVVTKDMSIVGFDRRTCREQGEMGDDDSLWQLLENTK